MPLRSAIRNSSGPCRARYRTHGEIRQPVCFVRQTGCGYPG
nr:hypothetical protein [Escherichia coli]